MTTFNKVNQFAEDIGKAVHNFGTHQLKIDATCAGVYALLTRGLADARR